LPGCPDIVLGKYRVAILVHGCFWHGHSCKDGRRPKTHREYWDSKLSKNVRRDKRNLVRLRKSGWRPVVIWACQLRNSKVLEQKLRRVLEIKTA
jgi:DNA mismatch endonuclease (patch repair protein)